MDDRLQKQFDLRIDRARALAEVHPAARELLIFYAELVEFQKGLLASGQAAGPDAERRLRDWLAVRAPAGAHAGDDFIRAVVAQPFAEASAAASSVHPNGSPPSAACPACGGPPILGVLRPEGQGARRRLVCALCLTEHDFLRVLCPSCGENRFDALPVFAAEQFPYVRIDACDTCHGYLKTIDLTKNGLAVPVVDDIASAPLDLWAREHGYERIRRNLLGL